MRITRPLAAVAAVATVATMLTTAPTAPAGAASPYDPRPAKSGAGWLAGQLDDGLVHNEQFDFDDIGLSIDVALGLDAAGKKPKVAKAITKAVAKNLGSYTGFGESVFAGALAKAAVLALVRDKDPRSFGGADLVAQLEDRVATVAPIAGRIEDAYDPDDEFGGDFANVVGQTYAARALALAGSAKARAVTAFLLQQQCAQGYFRQFFTSDKTRPDQSCQGAPRAERGASTDATALAVLALQDVKGAKAKAAVKKAVAWLLDRQHVSGAFTDTGKNFGTANANSTGLAGWALGESGAAKPAARAATFVRWLQVPGTNPCSGGLAKQAGAISYDDDAYAIAQSEGITKKTSDQWRRASSQALPVLRWAPRAEGDFSVSAPRRVPAGERFTIRITGAAAGERVCISEPGVRSEFPAGTTSTIRVSFAVPEGDSSRTYTVWLGSVRRTVTVRVTG
jgi:hypothetical protein